jgi:site-specific DNA-methyltransferase (adenine-specific)
MFKEFKNGILYNNDCMEVLKQIPSNSIDLVVTDPPYKVSARGVAGNSGGMLQKKINMRGNVFQYNDIDCEQYAPEFYRVLKDGSHCYVMTNHINLQHMLNTFTDLRSQEEKSSGVKPYGFYFTKCLIWDKGNKIMGQFYMSQFEYILFFRKGQGRKINNCGTSDILSIPNIKQHSTQGGNLHDTEKPVELMQILIENSTNPGDVVLEPFAGIGATLVAAEITGRRFIGCEIDPSYYEMSCNRLDDKPLEKTNLSYSSLW